MAEDSSLSTRWLGAAWVWAKECTLELIKGKLKPLGPWLP